MLFRNLHKLQGFKTKVQISFAKNFNKLKNSSNLSTKPIKQDQVNFLARKPKTGLLLVSLTLVPPLVPVIYAKDAKEINLKLRQISEKEVNDDKNQSADKTAQFEEQNFSWKELWSLIKPNFGYFLISILGSFVIAYLNIKIPICIGELTNQVSKYVNSEFDSSEFFKSIKLPALKLIWSYLLQGAFTTITITSLSSLGENIAIDLKMRLFKSIINQDIEFFDKTPAGEILSVMTTDLQEFKSSFKTFFSQGLRSICQTVGCAVSLYIISPKMTSFLCILVPNLVLVGSFISHFLRDISRNCQKQTAKCSAICNEVISSIRIIKACAMEDKEIKLYQNEINKLNYLNRSLGFGIALFQGLTNVALNGIILSTLLVGGKLMSNNEITPGDLMSFLVASQIIQRSLANLSLMTGHYIKYTNTGNRIFEYINKKEKITSGSLKLDPLIGEISFQKVNFSYPTRKEHKIFENLNLRINPGQTLALVGHSGSGKSTITMLLERFYDVDSGSINIDGVNIKKMDLNWLRSKNIGYISQEPTLFATSIMENIRYGCEQATDEEVYRAAKIANCHDFIEAFPESYKTQVGERGVTLSGGQRQRIAIAREILKNPKILICDEMSSALDSKNERLITEALQKLMKGKTVLVISHRLSTIKNADQIVVISNGKVCEHGNHDELVKREGLYWQLIKQQQSN